MMGQTEGISKKPFYKRVWFWVIAVIVVIIFAGAIGGGGDEGSASAGSTTSTEAGSTTTSASAETTAAEAPAVSVGIRQPLTVGDLVFTVTEVATTDTLDFYGDTKSGHWLVVNVNVANNSKEAVTIDSSYFKLLESDGTVYETDSDSIMYIDSEKSLFLEEINPKLSKDGQLLFAIPVSVDTNALTLQVQTGYFGTETGEISLTQ